MLSIRTTGDSAERRADRATAGAVHVGASSYLPGTTPAAPDPFPMAAGKDRHDPPGG